MKETMWDKGGVVYLFIKGDGMKVSSTTSPSGVC